MLRELKRIGILMAIGGVLGDVVTMLIAPSLLTWFQTPGAGTAMCNCAEVARQTAGSFVKAQLLGTAVGAATVAIVGELVFHLWLARRKPKPAAPPAG